LATSTTPEISVEPGPGLPSDVLYEIIDGTIVELPPMGTYPVEVASILFEYLGPFVRRAGLGRAIVEVLFRVDAKNQRRPDISYFSFAKWPKGRRTPDSQPWDVVPDLAIEAISKNDVAWDVLEKVRIYFEVGVRAVWLIYPNQDVIHVFESFKQIRVLTRDDVLDGGEVIPGFQLPLSLLFEEETAEGDPANPAN
jgi:Uma2 family endonuclease